MGSGDRLSGCVFDNGLKCLELGPYREPGIFLLFVPALDFNQNPAMGLQPNLQVENILMIAF